MPKKSFFPKLIKKPDGTIVDDRGEVVFTREEAERITMEKLRDWGRD